MSCVGSCSWVKGQLDVEGTFLPQQQHLLTTTVMVLLHFNGLTIKKQVVLYHDSRVLTFSFFLFFFFFNVFTFKNGMEINLLLQLNQVQFATTWKTQYAYTQKQRKKNQL